MDKTKVDLTRPAFGESAQKVEELSTESPSENSQAKEEKIVEPVSEPEESVEESEEETKVPYSRFKKFHDEALRLRQEAEELRSRVNQEPAVRDETDPNDEAYNLWLENFGDTEAARKAWKNQLKITQILQNQAIEQARQEAIEAVHNERYQEEARVEKNVETIDERFEDLSALVGRDLTEKEQSALLDIVDDYTPKDSAGNYLGELISFDKAWEIYELKTQSSQAPKRKSRDTIAAINASQSQGEPSNQAEKDKSFNPMDWGAWRKRV